MLIVSQDEERVINLNSTTIIEAEDGTRIEGMIWVDNYSIGEYKTKKRAKEVVKEIVNEYKNRIPDQNTVYYMPKE